MPAWLVWIAGISRGMLQHHGNAAVVYFPQCSSLGGKRHVQKRRMQTERNAELLSTLVAGGFDAKAKHSSPESTFEPIPQVTYKLSQTTLSRITLSHNLVAHNFVTQNLLHTT